MILYTHNNTELEYHPDINLLEIRWIKILQEDQLNVIWFEILQNTSVYNLQYLLFDASPIDSISFLCNQQSTFHFKSKLPNTSIEKIAIVTSELIKDKASFEKLLPSGTNGSLKGCQVKLFQHHYEAVDWLLEFDLPNNLL